MKTVISILIVLVMVGILYFLMIMPALGQKALQKELQKWYYAHRGLHDNGSDAPENSLAAFWKAVEQGFGMEMDVQLSKDRVPVVFHDSTLKRICGAEGKISDYTYQELQQFSLCGTKEKIPTLAQVLSLVGGRTPLIVELKTETMDTTICRLVDELLSDYPGLYCIESFNPWALFWYRVHKGEIVRGQLSDAFVRSGEFKGVSYWLLQNLLANWLSKPDFVAYNCKHPGILSRRICHKVFRNTAVAWTVKSPQQMEKIRRDFDIFIFEGFIPSIRQ